MLRNANTETVAKFLCEEWFIRYGIPRPLIADRGLENQGSSAFFLTNMKFTKWISHLTMHRLTAGLNESVRLSRHPFEADKGPGPRLDTTLACHVVGAAYND